MLISLYQGKVMVILLAYILALIWGGIWATFLQFANVGQFLVRKRTWITVVIGIGGDLVIIALVLHFELWLRVFFIVALSSVPIIIRSLINEYREDEEMLNVLRGKDRK